MHTVGLLRISSHFMCVSCICIPTQGALATGLETAVPDNLGTSQLLAYQEGQPVCWQVSNRGALKYA